MHWQSDSCKLATAVLLLILCATISSGCSVFRCPEQQREPRQPPPPAPKIVEVTKPCMSPLPPILAGPDDWPNPDKDGTTRLSREQAARIGHTISTLTDYLEEQYAKCGQEQESTTNPP